MHETTPKQEWVAPRIMRLDAAESTEGGMYPNITEGKHVVAFTVTDSFFSHATSNTAFYNGSAS